VQVFPGHFGEHLLERLLVFFDRRGNNLAGTGMVLGFGCLLFDSSPIFIAASRVGSLILQSSERFAGIWPSFQ
jgi:hypothetical protein